MKARSTTPWRAALAAALLGSAALAQDSAGRVADPVETFRLHVAALAAASADRSVLAGADGYLFLTAELRHLGLECFWGEAAATVSRAKKANRRDPLPAIVDFHDQLAAHGKRLVVVPVPARAAVAAASVPEFDGDVPPEARVDRIARAFYDVLRDRGVAVVDLLPVVRAAPEPMVCRTDSHWTSRACELAAAAIIDAFGDEVPARPDGVDDLGARRVVDEAASVRGDLVALLGAGDASESEALTLRRVVRGAAGAAGAADEPIASTDRGSPVVLIGDSHTLVFHAGGDLHATGAGLVDHLAHGLGYGVDLVGVRGSGATTPRIDLYRRKDQLADKQVVVWCFAVRELTESLQGWAKVPVLKAAKRDG